MNSIGDIECEYHSKHGLIEKISILSINDEDCFINILKNNSVIRTSTSNIQFLIKSHQPIKDVTVLKNAEGLILTEDNFCSFVNFIKMNDDETVDVLLKSNILVDGEQLIHTSINNLSICGEYLTFDGLKSSEIPIDKEYSRYLNNISIFKPLLSRVKNTLICWFSERSSINVKAVEECSLRKVEMLMPVFIDQLRLFLGGDMSGPMGFVARHIVWEYQYEDEEEANFAIGSKGAHIVAVRSMPGIAGAVLTKANRLRIIAENEHVLKEARSLLEIKRESYMFEESIVPMLIGKNATHINDLINKTGLHCIHLPNMPSNGVICERPLIVDPSHLGKRELFLLGNGESIRSANLLLEMEESVKDLKKEFECQKLRRQQQNSMMSSTSSVSTKESQEKPHHYQQQQQEEEEEDEKQDQEEEEENVVIVEEKREKEEPLAWADTPLEEEDYEQQQQQEEEEEATVQGVVEKQGETISSNHIKKPGNNGNNMRRTQNNVLGGFGSLVFTNSSLDCSSSSAVQKSGGHNRNRNMRQNWNSNNYYRPARNKHQSAQINNNIDNTCTR